MDPLIIAAITAFGVIASAYLTSQVSNRKLKTDSGLQLLNEHQEEIAELRKEIAALRRTQRIQGDYIGVLRRHIADGQPPPPPGWPDSLIT
jgi:transposase-like protein